jgi:hypothetical protein
MKKLNRITVPLKEVMDGQPGRPRTVVAKAVGEQNGRNLLIGFKGYGDLPSTKDDGYPVLLEVCNGRLRLVVWADINQEDPTHEIDLEGARESARIPEKARKK